MPLAAERIRTHLPRVTAERLPNLWVHGRLDSTNRYLRDRALAGAPGGCVCLAEEQTAGRGRRGRGWLSPAGGNLYLSLLWRFESGTESLSGLGLSAAVAAVRALESLNISGLGLKWPNDLYWQGRKLAGILVEAGGEPGGDCFAVVGIGLNVCLDANARARIDQPVADLREMTQEPIGRNALAAALIASLFQGMDGFEAQGFAASAGTYRRLDILLGVPVRLSAGNLTVNGMGAGVDSRGAFCLSVGDGIQTFSSGEVSVRGV